MQGIYRATKFRRVWHFRHRLKKSGAVGTVDPGRSTQMNIFLARVVTELVGFPEGFAPSFAVWGAVRSQIHNHKWFHILSAYSMSVEAVESGLTVS